MSWSCGCSIKLAHTGVKIICLFSHRCGGGKSQIKKLAVHTLSGGSRGETVLCLFQPLLGDIPWLVAATLSLYHWLLSVCACPICFYKDTFDGISGPLDDIPESSPHLKIFNSMFKSSSAITLFPRISHNLPQPLSLLFLNKCIDNLYWSHLLIVGAKHVTTGSWEEKKGLFHAYSSEGKLLHV